MDTKFDLIDSITIKNKYIYVDLRLRSLEYGEYQTLKI